METTKKYHIEKNTVQETLIIPLFGRKVCSEHFPHLFKDDEAERICNMLDYDFAEKGKKMETAVVITVNKIGQPVSSTAWMTDSFLFPVWRKCILKAFM